MSGLRALSRHRIQGTPGDRRDTGAERRDSRTHRRREPLRLIRDAARRNGTRFLREIAIEMVSRVKRHYRRSIVLRLWRDELRVVLAPEQVALVRIGGR